MEKLQQALHKARRERDATAAAQGRAVRGDARGANHGSGDGDTLADDAWLSIAPVTLDPEHLIRQRIVSHDNSRDSGAFDILRTKLMLQMKKHGWRRIAITSPTPVCGKSTVVCNLALGLSRQSDIRTVVLELDLRKPSIAEMLGVRPPEDIARMLSGDVSFQDQALRIRDNTAISIAQSATSDPTRYFLSEKLEARLAEIEAAQDPDLMIFDVPPLLAGDDTRALLRHVDCALLIARAEMTTVAQIDACEREIAEQTNVLGVVLNQYRHEDDTTGYGYGYGYGQ